METIDVIKMADDILAGADFDEDYIEHHGVKGQRWGERKFQYKDGSLTALGRQHYGIGSWIKSRFSSAERGYRAAVKQKQQQQKLAVKKAKYAGDLKKMIKNKKYFTDEEIDQQIMNDTRRQQALNRLKDLSNADKIRRQNEKIEKQERQYARKAQKFEQKMQKEALKAETQQKLNEQKTQLDIQKQKDKAQAEREQAQRDYQTQQKIAEGKTWLSKLQKGAKMAAAVSAIVGSTKKTFELLGFDADKINDATKAVEKVKGTAEKLKEATGEPKKTQTETSSPITKPQDHSEPSMPQKQEVNRLRTESTNHHDLSSTPLSKLRGFNADKYKDIGSDMNFKNVRKTLQQTSLDVKKDALDPKRMKMRENTKKILMEESERDRLDEMNAEKGVERLYNARRFAKPNGEQASADDFSNVAMYRDAAQRRRAASDKVLSEFMSNKTLNPPSPEEIESKKSRFSKIFGSKNTMEATVEEMESYTDYQVRRAAVMATRRESEKKDLDTKIGKEIASKYGSEYDDRNISLTRKKWKEQEAERTKNLRKAKEEYNQTTTRLKALDEEVAATKKNYEYYKNSGDDTKAKQWKNYLDEANKRHSETKEQNASAKQRLEQEQLRLEGKQKQEALEKAQDIKSAIQERSRLTGGPQSDFAKAVSSMSASKLASIMTEPVEDRPKALKGLSSGALFDQLTNPKESYLESLRKFLKQDDMEDDTEEDAGEVEDAE